MVPLAQLRSIVVGILGSMVGQLVTERFIKRAVLAGLKSVAKRTANEEDDALVKATSEAWGMQEDEPEAQG